MEVRRTKNAATYIVFPIVDADGDFVTGAASLDSEIDSWSDGSAPDGFADCTNEATEIGSTGMYYLSLTATEMNADYIAVQVKTSTSGAKTQMILINTTLQRADVIGISGDTAAADALETYCDGTTPQPVDVTTWKGSTAPAMTGDAYARLGAPAGASVSADIAAAKTAIDAVDDYVDTEMAAVLAAVDTEVAAIKSKTDNLPAAPAATGDIPSAATIADAVWDEAVADHSGVGSTGAALAAAGGSGDPWSTALPGAYGAGTAGKIIGDNLNAPVGTVDTVVDAIKAKTDNLPASPAAVGSAMTLEAGAITAAVIATDAIDGDAIAASAVSELQSGLATAADLATVDGIVDAILVDTGTDIPAAIAALPTDADVQTAAAAALTAYDPPTKAELDSGLAALNDVSAAEVGLEVDASLAAYDVPTKAELDAAVAPLATAAGVAAIDSVTDKLDTAMELDGAVYRFTTNALEMSPAGGGAGDAPTVEEIRAEMDANSTRLASIDGKLASTTISVQSPVAQSGAITVHSGDDYDATHGRSLDVTVDDVPSLSGATVKLKCAEATWTGTASAGAGTAWVLRFEPTAAETAVLTKRTQAYEIEAVLSDGDVVTLGTGTLSTVRDIPEVV